jgi:hypothetical protein
VLTDWASTGEHHTTTRRDLHLHSAHMPLHPSAIHISRLNRDHYRNAQWWTPTHGVRLPLGMTSLPDRAAALTLVTPPTTALSERTSAALWGGPLPLEIPLEVLHVTLPPGGFHIQRPDVVCHRRSLSPEDIRDVDGLRLTSPERTLVDLAGVLSLPHLVALGDDFLRRNLMTQRDLHNVVQQSRKQRGIPSARTAAMLLDARSESPRESVTRVLLWQGGFPMPTPNVDICDASGNFVARGDLVYEDLRIVIEYDGSHHLTPGQQSKDADRRLKLNVLDWLIVEVVSRDIRTPQRLYDKVLSAFAYRGATPLTLRPRTRPRT